jgi:hypothetical protein
VSELEAKTDDASNRRVKVTITQAVYNAIGR